MSSLPETLGNCDHTRYSSAFALQELAAALEHAGDEHDTLLTEAAAAAELRVRLTEVAAERDALSQQCAQLQRDVRQQEAAGNGQQQPFWIETLVFISFVSSLLNSKHTVSEQSVRLHAAVATCSG